MDISIIMATYNGEDYIREQLNSIVGYLKPRDELLISDDGSTDDTIQIIEEYVNKYPNVKLVYGPHDGTSMNFMSTVPKCNGDIVLFCDQDDIWMSEKIETIRSFFESHPDIQVVMHNATFCDGEGNTIDGTIFTRRNARHGVIRNLFYSTYYGCCMGARREFLLKYCSLLRRGTQYDQYLGSLAEWEHCSEFLDKKLIIHRYHGGNQSKRLRLWTRLGFKVRLLNNVSASLRRKKNNDR